MALRSLIWVVIFSLVSCTDDDPRTRVTFEFHHVVDGEAVTFNALNYTNAAGNNYEVTEVMWFISDLSLIGQNGSASILQGEETHYIDSNLEHTLTLNKPEWIAPGKYTTLRFTFGIKPEHNTPGRFPNLPESDMLWPYSLGGDNGGYHLMKLNGFWLDPEGKRRPFNVHLGTGQLYNIQGNVTAFIDNSFTVELDTDITIEPDKKTCIEITMNIQSWFETPHMYDHNIIGSHIMKNQHAMEMLRENGADVFTVSYETSR